jgi:dihydrofolate synthase/folylpolyglutamate synthase
LPAFPVELTLDHVSLKMPGEHQIQNAAAAISAFLLAQRQQGDEVVDKHPSSPWEKNTIRNALRHSSIPLRVEIIHQENDRPTTIFDGAHNRASMQALVKTLTEIYPNRRRLLIFGASLDKDVVGMFDEMIGHVDHLFLTQSSCSNRRFPPQDLRTILALPDANVSVVEDCNDAWERCTCMATKEDVICITGSLYLAAELRQHVFVDKRKGVG